MTNGYTPEKYYLPPIEVAGTTRECGLQLGERWRDLLQRNSAKHRGEQQWWAQPTFRRLVDRIAPHLPELYVGMAEGAEIAPDELIPPVPRDLVTGCTSFAVAPSASRDVQTICGQTKDARAEYTRRNVILKMSVSDAPSALTMTYPGMFFGHGFVIGGCAIFRNSIAVNSVQTVDPLPYNAWGLLALHCKTVAEVCALTESHPIAEPFHCTIADSHGGIVGIEHADGDTAILKPVDGLYTHANNIVSDEVLLHREICGEEYRQRSEHRRNQLMKRLRGDDGRSTPESVREALRDHEGYPCSVCNHESERFCTTAALIAQPTRGSLTVFSGPPCCNPFVEYRIENAVAGAIA